MDLRIGLLLLLLLAYASGTCTHTSGSHGPPIPLQHPPVLPAPNHHRRQLAPQRPQRELSEFLVPPPMPLNFRGPRGPPPPRVPRRYQPKYFSKLMTWLNPFKPGSEEAAKPPPVANSINNNNKVVMPPQQPLQPQPAASQQRLHVAQYAPQQPYVGPGTLYDSQAQPTNHQQSNHQQTSGITTWMNGKPCNPCNQVPWVPMFPENYPSQYAPNSGQNTYLPPVTSQETHHQNPYVGVMPPLAEAQPFHQQQGSGFNHQPQASFSSGPSSFEHHSASSYDSQPPSSFDHQSSFNGPSPGNFDHHSPPSFNGPSSGNFDHHSPPSFNGPSSGNFDHHSPPSFNGPPSGSYDNHPSNSQPAGDFDHHPSSSFNSPSSGNFDHPPSNFNSQPPGNFDLHPPSNFNSQPPGNFDHHPPSFNGQPPGNFDSHQSSIELDHPPPDHDSQNFEDHPPSSSDEQHHQSSQIIGVVKEAPNREPDHAESRPVYVGTSSQAPPTLTPRPLGTKTFHFQRSPIIDLSVAGESTTTTTTTTSRPVYRLESKDKKPIPTLKPKPQPVTTISSVSVIDYIVDETAFASSEERDIPSATTTSTTTERIPDQRSQESFIETLVQSYEIFRKDGDDDKRINVKPSPTPPPQGQYNETEDSSASKESIVMPSKSESGEKNKKIIQIIIPYTSQYTASPFHPTRSGISNGHARGSNQQQHPEELDNAVIEESRRVSVTRKPPVVEEEKSDPLRNNNRTKSKEEREEEEARLSNTIDVHRLQKNIDNWTIQEYSSKSTMSSKRRNSTYPRWLSSKQIPDEYLLTATDLDESSEYYDFTNETKAHRGINRTTEVTSTTTTPNPPSTSTTRVNIINATYPKKPKKSNSSNEILKLNSTKQVSSSGEQVYVVTPVPTRNSGEQLDKRRRRPKGKEQRDTVSVEQAYQVLPQAVNNLAVVSSVPNSAAPVLWGIMEHEEVKENIQQPRWRSESDAISETDSSEEIPAKSPILYSGHSKVSRAR